MSFGLRGGKARIPSLETIARLIDDPVLTERDWTTWDVLTRVRRGRRRRATGRRRVVLTSFDCGAVRVRVRDEPDARARELAARAVRLRPTRGPRVLLSSGAPSRWAHIHVAPSRSGGDNPREAPEITAQTAGGAWTGTRILEFGAGAAGPIATRYFAEHGATVLRVESASRPDFLRTGNYADMFDALNCGKRSVSLELEASRGTRARQATRRRVGRRGRRELRTEGDARARAWPTTTSSSTSPTSSWSSACLNGQTGPHRDYPGFGGQGAALSGFNYLTGWPDREPIGPFGTITDSLAPRFVATAMAAALLHHRATGNGVYVDLSQVECAAWTLSDWLLAYKRDGVIGERRGNAHPDAALHGVFRCAGDDRWVAIAAWTDDELQRLHAIAGDDVEAWTSTRDPLGVATQLQDAGLEAVPVQDFADLNADPQLAHRGHFVALDHPELGPGEYERNGFRIDGLAAGLRAQRADTRAGRRLGARRAAGPVHGRATAAPSRRRLLVTFVPFAE